MRFSLPFAVLMFGATFTTQAQNTTAPFEDLPPTSEYGKCYAKCKIPDKYETVEVQVLVTPERKKTVRIPAQFETVSEQILVKEGSMSYRTIPATFRTVTEQVLAEPERRVTRTIPAQYRTESYQVLVSEARGEWVKKKKAPNCFSSNPDDCYIACWEEVPAKYRTETRTIEVSPASIAEDVIPAKYKTISKQIVDQPARTVETPIEAVYRTVTRRQVVTPESTREEVIPAVYTTKKERRLISQGGFTVWTEILCESKTTSDRLVSVQRALEAKGYNPGPIDGRMGVKTQTALRQYQKDNNLPEGNLNIETLKSLGVDAN